MDKRTSIKFAQQWSSNLQLLLDLSNAGIRFAQLSYADKPKPGRAFRNVLLFIFRRPALKGIVSR